MKSHDKCRILYLVAHPFLRESRSTQSLIDAVRDIPGLTVHSLYDLYPYFEIDAEQEKQLLLEHDTIVIQHPFYWYSMPPLMRLWLDDVLDPDWAYGPRGQQLRGKKLMLSMTIGGAADSYGPHGYNRYPFETFLAPWEQIAHLCHMQWQPPQLLFNSTRVGVPELEAHGKKLRQSIKGACS